MEEQSRCCATITKTDIEALVYYIVYQYKEQKALPQTLIEEIYSAIENKRVFKSVDIRDLKIQDLI